MQPGSLMRFEILDQGFEDNGWVHGRAVDGVGAESSWLAIRGDVNDAQRSRGLSASIGAWGVEAYSGHPANQDFALFRVFADLTDSPEALLVAARRYGPLGVEQRFTPEGKESPVWGETLEDWSAAVAALKTATRVSEALRTNADERTVAGLAMPWIHEATYLDGQRFMSLDPLRLPYLGRNRERRFIKAGLTLNSRDEIAAVAPEALHQVIAAHLYAYAHVGFGNVEREYGVSRLHFSSSYLIGALWLQLARSTEGYRYKPCERADCGRYIEIRPDKTRDDRDYCSNSCRQKAYRDRKKLIGDKPGGEE